jgi:hypothetical protein
MINFDNQALVKIYYGTREIESVKYNTQSLYNPINGLLEDFEQRVVDGGGVYENNNLYDFINTLVSNNLYNNASFIMSPSGYKAGKVYSQKPLNGDGDLTFTRASTATRVNPQGLIEEVAVNVPRIDYTGGGCGKLLLEPQRTNIFRNSENLENLNNQGFSGSYSFALGRNWTVHNENETGTTSYSRIIGLGDFPSAADKYATISGYVRDNGGDFISLPALGGAAVTSSIAFINVYPNGTIRNFQISPLNIQNYTYTLEEISENYYKFSTTIQIVSGATDYTNLNICAGNYNNDGETFNCTYSYLNIELDAPYATSYIPTSGAAVTRLADNISTSGLNSVIGQTEGSVFIEFKTINEGGIKDIFRLQESGLNFIELFYSNGNELNWAIRDAGVEDNFASSYSFSDNETLKCVITYQDGECKIKINNSPIEKKVMNFNTTVVYDILNFYLGTNYFGKVNKLVLFKNVLTDNDMEQLVL